MLIDDLVQQSPEWHEMRKGLATGSMIADATTKTATQPHVMKNCEKGKHGMCSSKFCSCSCHGEDAATGTNYTADRDNYLWDLIATRMTGQMPDRYVSRAMKFGVENEPLAIAAYEHRMGCMTEPVGFAFHPRIKWFGASPDGLIGDDGCIEVKCPTSAIHLRYIVDGVVPADYIPQMKAVMACAERQWCDFVSYDPRQKPEFRLFIRRLERDEPMIQEMEQEVEFFLAEVEHMQEVIERKKVAMVMVGMEAKYYEEPVWKKKAQ